VSFKEVQAKSILRKHKKIDSWFISRYGMNLYRGCVHNCIYCDGRSERYFVEGRFGEDLVVKTNAPEILRRELDPRRKRSPLKRSYIIIGGGVNDSYQPLEKTYRLTRKVLQIVADSDLPVHILTKSVLVQRDIDILKSIHNKNGVIVSFSISSVDDRRSAFLEPGVPAPSKRLEALSFFKKNGIPCGLFLLPVIPFITDSEKTIAESVSSGKNAGADFIIFGGMTLKEGEQKKYFLEKIGDNFPDLIQSYQDIYPPSKWGGASGNYYDLINKRFLNQARKFQIPVRIPLHLYNNKLDENDLVIVILEHIDYLLKLKGKSSPYGYAAYSISKLDKSLADRSQELQTIKGVGDFTAGLIREIQMTGTSSYYEQLMKL
jgi:DNA repair photolyase